MLCDYAGTVADGYQVSSLVSQRLLYVFCPPEQASARSAYVLMSAVVLWACTVRSAAARLLLARILWLH